MFQKYVDYIIENDEKMHAFKYYQLDIDNIVHNQKMEKIFKNISPQNKIDQMINR